MDTFLGIVPFAAAESLLVWSLWRLHRVAFLASVLALILACGGAVLSEGASALFAIIGVRATVFGATCLYLGARVGADPFLSNRGLCAIGALLFFAGLASLFIA
jgi:hypothetical protein